MLVAQQRIVIWTPENDGGPNALVQQGCRVVSKTRSSFNLNEWILWLEKATC